MSSSSSDFSKFLRNFGQVSEIHMICVKNALFSQDHSRCHSILYVIGMVMNYFVSENKHKHFEQNWSLINILAKLSLKLAVLGFAISVSCHRLTVKECTQCSSASKLIPGRPNVFWEISARCESVLLLLSSPASLRKIVRSEQMSDALPLSL